VKTTDDAREFRQYRVAGRLHDAAGMLADLRVDELAAIRLQAPVRGFSSAPIRREYPATSAARIPGFRRDEDSAGRRLSRLLR